MADLEFVNISKSFDGVYALKNASFKCNRGEVHALLGENGAGKSTLVKVLSGAHEADSGEIKIFGKVVNIKKPSDAMAYRIGTVYQELSLIPHLTVSENIFIGRIPKNRLGYFRRKELYKMTMDLLEKYAVQKLDPDAKVGALSLSQKQMIEILKILSKNPEIVIFDEATSALSEDKVKWLLNLARKLAEQDKIIIFISHRMAEIMNGCDSITILRNGSTVGEMSIGDVNMDKVISMMLGRKIEAYFPEKINSVQDKIALEVRDLRCGNELNGVSFILHKGEVLGIGGLAGQGQTELMLAIFGVIKSKGEMLLDGKLYKGCSPGASIKKGIALVPEDRTDQGLLSNFSIGFNISLSSLWKMRRGLFINRKKEMEVIKKYINILSIRAESHEMAVQDLSGGNQQKVVLAKMLATSPVLLLMHDITRGVDVGTKKEIFNLVRELAVKGNAILYLSTDVEELVNICDRVLVLYDGGVSASLSGGDLTQENIIGAAIGET